MKSCALLRKFPTAFRDVYWQNEAASLSPYLVSSAKDFATSVGKTSEQEIQDIWVNFESERQDCSKIRDPSFDLYYSMAT
jgi:hypothetical protein